MWHFLSAQQSARFRVRTQVTKNDRCRFCSSLLIYVALLCVLIILPAVNWTGYVVWASCDKRNMSIDV